MPANIVNLNKVELRLANIDSLAETAGKFLSSIGSYRLIAFYGSMGAGKTTFIKAICEELGAIDVVTSPTFTLINEYHTLEGPEIYHFDFYRIEEVEEALDFGFEEYLDRGNFCFMEWPERIEPLLPENVLKVYISVNEDQSRTISFGS